MTLAETIYQHSLKLPEAAAREALDFIEFLEQHYAPALVSAKQQNDTEAFLAGLSDTINNDECLAVALRLSSVIWPEAENETER
jgi:hypothetical protein